MALYTRANDWNNAFEYPVVLGTRIAATRLVVHVRTWNACVNVDTAAECGIGVADVGL